MTITNTLRWKEHLYGEVWRNKSENNIGLNPTLMKRLTILRRLSKYTNKQNMKLYAEGIVMAKMRYSLPVIVNIWNENIYTDTTRKMTCFTKKDTARLQSIQNQTLKLQVGTHEKKNLH